jgi:hypothetical protein
MVRAGTVWVGRRHEDAFDVREPLSNSYEAWGRNIGEVISDRRSEGAPIDRARKDDLITSAKRTRKIIGEGPRPDRGRAFRSH